MEVFVFLLFIAGIVYLPKHKAYKTYKRSGYSEASGNSFWAVVSDRGCYGEFLTFSYLEKLDGYHKLLVNLYIPKKDGSTTEVDLIMISEHGIYVFESKNYSGWIFGDEKNRYWAQTLPRKQKNQFYNPIWQNNGHISALKSLLAMEDDLIYKSYIVFSERCTLKRITVTSPNVKVIKRDAVARTIMQDMMYSCHRLSIQEVDRIYTLLQKYTRADAAVRESHVQNIRSRKQD